MAKGKKAKGKRQKEKFRVSEFSPPAERACCSVVEFSWAFGYRSGSFLARYATLSPAITPQAGFSPFLSPCAPITARSSHAPLRPKFVALRSPSLLHHCTARPLCCRSENVPRGTQLHMQLLQLKQLPTQPAVQRGTQLHIQLLQLKQLPTQPLA